MVVAAQSFDSNDLKIQLNTKLAVIQQHPKSLSYYTCPLPTSLYPELMPNKGLF